MQKFSPPLSELVELVCGCQGSLLHIALWMQPKPFLSAASICTLSGPYLIAAYQCSHLTTLPALATSHLVML